MGSNLRTREAIIYGEGESRTFQDIIEAASTFGWHSFDQSLLKAYQENLITEETALVCCTHKNKMGRDIDMTKKLKNADFAGSSGLKMVSAPQPSAPPPVPAIPPAQK